MHSFNIITNLFIEERKCIEGFHFLKEELTRNQKVLYYFYIKPFGVIFGKGE